jgi:hypothetical protein
MEDLLSRSVLEALGLPQEAVHDVSLHYPTSQLPGNTSVAAAAAHGLGASARRAMAGGPAAGEGWGLLSDLVSRQTVLIRPVGRSSVVRLSVGKRGEGAARHKGAVRPGGVTVAAVAASLGSAAQAAAAAVVSPARQAAAGGAAASGARGGGGGGNGARLLDAGTVGGIAAAAATAAASAAMGQVGTLR